MNKIPLIHLIGLVLAFVTSLVTPGLVAQNPIILDGENAPFVLEFEEVDSINYLGPAFSLMEYNEGWLWVSYPPSVAGSRVMMRDKKAYELKWMPFNGGINNLTAFDPLKLDEAHYGPATYDPEDDVLIFTASQPRGYRGKSQLGLYYAQPKSGDQKPKLIPFQELEYNYAHPSWDGVNQRLFFSSDMDSENGQMNLYFVKRHGENWSTPQQLSDLNNDSSNEIFPFISEAGLFFASDRPGGMGGLDQYFSPWTGESFDGVVQLPEPFNSPFDDFALWLHENESEGYFSTNRTGEFNHDHIIKFICPDNCFLPASVVKSLEVQVISADESQPLKEVDLYFIPEKLFFDQMASSKIEFDPIQNKLSLGQLSDLLEQRGVINCQSNREGRCLMESQTNQRQFILFAKREGLQSYMHRIEFAEGFDHRLVELKMYRDCKPIVVQLRCPEGDSILNPRIWIESFEDGSIDSLMATENGYSFCRKVNDHFALYATADERLPVKKMVNIKNADPDTLIIEFESKEVEIVREGSVLELENIYYEYNSHLIQADAAAELDQLASVMKQDTSMVIELRAHTDSRGGELYNLQLSQRRANSALEYLVTLGVQQSRIRTVGLGESQLRNHCKPGVNCTEEQHAFNRRTEVAVIQAGEGVRVRRGSDGLEFTIYEE